MEHGMWQYPPPPSQSTIQTPLGRNYSDHPPQCVIPSKDERCGVYSEEKDASVFEEIISLFCMCFLTTKLTFVNGMTSFLELRWLSFDLVYHIS